MGKLIHPRGDLEMTIEDVVIEDKTLCINGKMGVWKAQIRLAPDEVAAVVCSLLKPQLIRDVPTLLWELRPGKKSGSSIGPVNK